MCNGILCNQKTNFEKVITRIKKITRKFLVDINHNIGHKGRKYVQIAEVVEALPITTSVCKMQSILFQ